MLELSELLIEIHTRMSLDPYLSPAKVWMDIMEENPEVLKSIRDEGERLHLELSPLERLIASGGKTKIELDFEARHHFEDYYDL